MTRDRRSRRLRSSGRRSLLAGLVVVASLPAGGAHASPARTRGVLTSSTTIAWTGAKGLRLTVPAEVNLPTYGARLTLRGGSYAFVRIAPVGLCDGGVRCMKGMLDYTHDMAPMLRRPDQGPGEDHLSRIGGNNLVRSDYELYLFTDGAATLTFDATGLRTPRNAITAAGRIRGSVRVLPITCAAPGCSTTDGHDRRLFYGGASANVGHMGSADVIVGTYDRAGTPLGDYPNVRTVRGCVYPRHLTDTTPPRSDTGCDMTDRDMPADAANMAFFAINGGKASFLTYGNPSGRGTIWLGYQITQAHDLADAVAIAYGVWLTYGMS